MVVIMKFEEAFPLLVCWFKCHDYCVVHKDYYSKRAYFECGRCCKKITKFLDSN